MLNSSRTRSQLNRARRRNGMGRVAGFNTMAGLCAGICEVVDILTF